MSLLDTKKEQELESERIINESIEEIFEEKEAISETSTVTGTEEIPIMEEEFQTKSKTNKRLVRNSFNYEDIISQTQEISVNIKKTELDQIKENSRHEEEILQNKSVMQESLSNKDIVAMDSHKNYNIVISGSQRNYERIFNRNTSFTVRDMSIQTQLYLLDDAKFEIKHIEHTIKTFILNVFSKISRGIPIVLNPVLIFDIIVFDQSKILPIAVANPKLLQPVGILEWTNLVKEGDKKTLKIVDTFIHLLEGTLTNGHEVEFFDGTILTRNRDGITSLYINDASAKAFNAAVQGELPKAIPY